MNPIQNIIKIPRTNTCILVLPFKNILKSNPAIIDIIKTAIGRRPLPGSMVCVDYIIRNGTRDTGR